MPLTLLWSENQEGTADFGGVGLNAYINIIYEYPETIEGWYMEGMQNWIWHQSCHISDHDKHGHYSSMAMGGT